MELKPNSGCTQGLGCKPRLRCGLPRGAERDTRKEDSDIEDWEEGKEETRREKKGDMGGSRGLGICLWSFSSGCLMMPHSLVDDALRERQQAKEQQPLHGSSWLPRHWRRQDKWKVCRSRQELLLIYGPCPDCNSPYQPVNATCYHNLKQNCS